MPSGATRSIVDGRSAVDVSRFVSRISGRTRISAVESRETSPQIPRLGGPERHPVDARPTTCKQQVRSSILLSGSRFQGFSALGMLRIRRLLIPC